VHKLYIAFAMLGPIVGCAGVAGDASSAFGGESGVRDAGTPSGAGGNGSSTMAGTGSTTSTGAGSTGAGSTGAGSTGAGGVNPGAGLSTSGGSSSGGACSVEALPATIQTMISNKCSACHGATPLAGLPSLVSYANLVAQSKSDPSKTNAMVALARVQSTTTPMPPAPGTPASAGEVAALQDFISQGYPKPSCPTGNSGGASGAAGSAGGGSAGAPSVDPLNAMPTCTSMTTWKNGNKGSSSMNPGMACITCHKSGGEGPSFSIAGTVFPTGHEPNLCNSSIGTAGARIVIIGADGKMTTLTPNAAGNFSSNTAIKTPYQAKVTYQGRERLMQTAQSSGDCNSCHTQSGSMMAPGRITAP